jgi:6-phosphogluconolactonase (cycloisomerase 2 family)
MRIIKTTILVFTLNMHAPLLHAVCNSGTLTLANTIGTGAGGGTPYFNAYSPIIAGNMYYAVANFGTSLVSVFSVNTSTGVLTAVSGSPFTAGSGPVGISFSPVIYGNLFAASGNNSSGAVSVFQVNPATGSLTQVSGSPFSAVSSPWETAFSPLVNGNVFVGVANNGSNILTVYSMNTVTGALTTIASPATGAAGSHPRGFAFSPIVNGNLFAAAANGGTGDFAIFSVNTSTGAFTAATGSPFSIGANTIPTGIAFSPVINGNLFLAVTQNSNNGSNNTGSLVSVYSINTSTGVPTAVSGSPFTTGTGPSAVAFSPFVNGNLYAAVSNFATNNVSVYTVNTSTGAFTLASTTSVGAATGPFGMSFSPIMTGGLFLATTNQTTNATSAFQVATIIPTITTLSQFILSGASVTLNGTITGGTANYAITWQDGVVQSGIATTTFSRIVSPTTPTIYDVATISDSNACTAGPSNSITIGVRTCP